MQSTPSGWLDGRARRTAAGGIIVGIGGRKFRRFSRPPPEGIPCPDHRRGRSPPARRRNAGWPARPGGCAGGNGGSAPNAAGTAPPAAPRQARRAPARVARGPRPWPLAAASRVMPKSSRRGPAQGSGQSSPATRNHGCQGSSGERSNGRPASMAGVQGRGRPSSSPGAAIGSTRSSSSRSPAATPWLSPRTSTSASGRSWPSEGLDRRISSSISGQASAKDARRGIRICRAKVGGVRRVSRCWRWTWRRCSGTAASWARIGAICSRYSRPWEVSASERPSRCNRLTPSIPSRPETRLRRRCR